MDRALSSAIPAFNGWGIETSHLYADEHERHLYCEIRLRALSGQPIRVLDVACGMGVTSARLADVGAHVTSLDLNPATQDSLRDLGYTRTIDFIHADFRQLPPSVTNARYDYILFQRALDCVPGRDGIKALRQLEKLLVPRGRLYLTVSGLDAPYAEDYAGRTVSLKDRFHPLKPEYQSEHSFYNPICMWGVDDVRSVLSAQEWKTHIHYQSAKGSHKIIAEKKPFWEKRLFRRTVGAVFVMAALLTGNHSRGTAPISPPENPHPHLYRGTMLGSPSLDFRKPPNQTLTL